MNDLFLKNVETNTDEYLAFLSGNFTEANDVITSLEHTKKYLQNYKDGEISWYKLRISSYDFQREYFKKNKIKAEEISKCFTFDYEKNKSWINSLVGSGIKPFLEYLSQEYRNFPYSIGYSRKPFRNQNISKSYLYSNMFFSLLDEYAFLLVISEPKLKKFTTKNILTPDEFIDKETAQMIVSKLPLIASYYYDHGNQLIIDTAKEAITGDNNANTVSHELIRGIFYSKNRELVELLKKLLLAAQRQEGLRQSILEKIDEGRIEYFVEFIHLMIEENLLRFSSAIRAMMTWINLYDIDITRKKYISDTAELIKTCLTDDKKRHEYLQGSNVMEIYIALWAGCVYDTSKIEEDLKIVLEKSEEYVFVAALDFINMLQDRALSYQLAERILKVTDSNEVIALIVKNLYFDRLRSYYGFQIVKNENSRKNSKIQKTYTPFLTQEAAEIMFEKFMQLYHSMKRASVSYSQSGIGGNDFSIHRNDVQRILIMVALTLGNEEKLNQLGHLANQSEVFLDYVIEYLNTIETKEQRDILVSMLSSKEENIIKQAKYYVDVLGISLDENEIISIENNLRLKSETIRLTSLEIVTAQPTKDLEKSVNRLLESSKLEMRLAGLDIILNTVMKEEKFHDICEKTIDLVKNREWKNPSEIALTDQILGKSVPKEILTVENGFGMYEENLQNQLPQLSENKKFDIKETLFSLSYEEFKSYHDILKKFINDHKDAIDTLPENFGYYDDRKVILGNFPSISRWNYQNGERVEIFLFKELWDEFREKENIPYQFYFEYSFITRYQEGYVKNQNKNPKAEKIFKKYFPDKEIEKKSLLVKVSVYDGSWQYFEDHVIQDVLRYYFKDTFSLKHLEASTILLENLYFHMDDSLYKEKDENRWRTEVYCLVSRLFFFNYFMDYLTKYLNCVMGEKEQNESFIPKILSLKAAYFNKCLPLEEYSNTRSIQFFQNGEIALGYEKGIFSKNDLIQYALNTHEGLIKDATYRPDRKVSRYYFQQNRVFSTKFPKSDKVLKELVDRIVGVEVMRGDSPTEATPYISYISSYENINHFTNLLARLDKKDTFVRGYSYYRSSTDKKTVISSLIQSAFPSQSDNKDTFIKALDGRKIDKSILINVVLYANQWEPIISDYLGYPGLKDLMYYFIAHTGEYTLKNMEETLAVYSPVKVSEFQEGVFDIDWFKRAYKGVPEDIYALTYDAAKYISSANTHKRARLYADAVLKKLKIKEVEERINDKRNQDYVKAYGVIPLGKNRETDLINRYNLLQKFLKESKKFGQQRKASEGKAVDIAMNNLSKTAKFPNPTSMGLYLDSLISKGNMEVLQSKEIDGYKIDVDTEELGNYKLIIYNEKGKGLKTPPAKLKKNPEFVEMKEVIKESQEQYRRTIRSFESFMEIEEKLFAKDLITIMDNPLFHSFLENIVFVIEDHIGYLIDGKLQSPDGKSYEIKESDVVKVAHPYDLLTADVWSIYQKDLFDRQVSQPFKQVFRELYTPNEDELSENLSRRYAGHQLQRKQLFALMNQRNWVGDGRKVFYNQNIIADLYGISNDFSPGDIEEPVLEFIEFIDKETGKRVNIKDVPPVLFSEIMRDVDLFVSVAYVGGVDPEASLSTIEMRSMILDEMILLLGYKNVKIDGNFAYVKGTFGEYNIHLGSANVQKMGKGSISILAIHEDRRGRIFLPFMDQDPKTAEVISKIVLLAEDEKIKDPTILSQIK